MRRTKAYYSLKEVKKLISDDDHHIIEPRARKSADDHFSWKYSQIKKAILGLQPKHYYKTEPKYDNPKMLVDYYKAYGLYGEDIYIHLRIDDGMLIICSFKAIESTL